MSDSLKARLQHDLHDAMRAHDKVVAGTLRMTLAAITMAEVAGHETRTLTDDEVLKVIAKEAKKRKEAHAAYLQAGRSELAATEAAELDVLEGYLPAQLDDAELAEMVRTAIEQTGASGMAQMGQVMKAAQGIVAGRAEGGRVAAIVKRLLAG